MYPNEKHWVINHVVSRIMYEQNSMQKKNNNNSFHFAWLPYKLH